MLFEQPDRGKALLMRYPWWMWDPPKVTQLNDGAKYRAFLFDPSTAEEHILGEVMPDPKGEWPLPIPPVVRDWMRVLDAQG